jgi:hypothetical protein
MVKIVDEAKVKLFLIKDDYVKKITAIYKYGSNGKIVFKSTDLETRLVSETMEVSEDEAMQMLNFKGYEALLDSGYSIVKLTQGKDETNLQFFLGTEVSNEIYNKIIQIQDKLEKGVSFIEIYNRVKKGEKLETEFVSSRISKQEFSKMYNTLRIFIADKNNELSEYDAEILERFRKFDLKRIISTETSKDDINVRNSGVILITPTEFVGSTNRQEIHTTQFETLIKERYYNSFKEEDFLDKMASKFNCILVYLSNEGYLPIILYKPEKITSFQYEKLRELIEQIDKLKKIDGRDFSILYSDVGDNIEIKDSLVSSSEFKKSIENKYLKMVDNTIQEPVRSYPKPHKIITKELVDSIFDPVKTLKGNISSIMDKGSNVTQKVKDFLSFPDDNGNR